MENHMNRDVRRTRVAIWALVVMMLPESIAWSQTKRSGSGITRERACTPGQREATLRSWQTLVLNSFPREVDSLESATRPGGVLEGWRLSHGHVAIAGSAAVPLDNINMKAPMPQVLLYAPSPSSSTADWMDFDGPDGPYRLVGWAYIGPFKPGSVPPQMRCLRDREWVLHEAGWHLMNGSMLLTPDADTEPPRPRIRTGILMWHPQVWDIHFWIGEYGPTVSFNRPGAPDGGLTLPAGAFYTLQNGRKAPVRQHPPCPVDEAHRFVPGSE